MPIYEYKCGKCGRDFEKLISYIDLDLDYNKISCDDKNCNGLASKVISAPSPSPRDNIGYAQCLECGEELIPVMVIRMSNLSKENLH